jgi:signal transduction histidine kinase
VPIIRRDGTFFGTLCAIDPKPATLNNTATIGMFTLFADLVSFHLSSIEKLASAAVALLSERKTAEAREQFIAILGHDLLNPVNAVLNSAQLMMRGPLDERGARLANIIQDSTYRIKGLIDNMLDFARGRLGEGIILNYSDEPLDKILEHAITELRVIWPDRVIDSQLDLPGPVYCDGKRIAQLFSNLLGNALMHGKKDMPVKVHAVCRDGVLKLSVANAGSQIPAAVMERLFQPFSRGEVKPGQQGLGLGLYIASEIADAHDGKLSVLSTPEETCFTLLMPAEYS